MKRSLLALAICTFVAIPGAAFADHHEGTEHAKKAHDCAAECKESKDKNCAKHCEEKAKAHHEHAEHSEHAAHADKH